MKAELGESQPKNFVEHKRQKFVVKNELKSHREQGSEIKNLKQEIKYFQVTLKFRQIY